MKKLFYFLVSVALFFSAGQSALAQGANSGSCAFSNDGTNFACTSFSGPLPSGCTPQGGVFYCPQVPAGYTAPSISITFSADPSEGAAGTNPKLTWSVNGVSSDPTTCTGTNFSTGGAASGSTSAGALNSAGTTIYTLTCKNSSSTKNATASVTIKPNAGNCDFPSSAEFKEYGCYPTSGGAPQGCTAMTGALGGGYDCPTVPSGYLPPSRTVDVTVSPASGEAGKINPSIHWSVQDVQSDPATCSIPGLVSGGPAEGSVSPGVINSAGSVTYTVTCQSKIPGVVTGSKTVTITAATAAASQTPSTQQTTQADPCRDAGGGKLGYCALEPLPGFTNGASINFPQFLDAVFKILLTVGAMFAVGMLVYAGISYIVSGSGVEIGEAKKRMWAALFGLGILLGAWLLLSTINPTLLKFDLTSVGTLNKGGATQTPNGADNIGTTPSHTELQQMIDSH